MQAPASVVTTLQGHEPSASSPSSDSSPSSSGTSTTETSSPSSSSSSLSSSSSSSSSSVFPHIVIPSTPSDEDPELVSYFHSIKAFVKDDNLKVFDFPPSLTSTQRKKVHSLAERFNLDHQSIDIEVNAPLSTGVQSSLPTTTTTDASTSTATATSTSPATLVSSNTTEITVTTTMTVGRFVRLNKAKPSHRGRARGPARMRSSSSRSPSRSAKDRFLKRYEESLPPPPSDKELVPLYEEIKQFALDSTAGAATTHDFPLALSSEQRRKVHEIAELFFLKHESQGDKEEGKRFVRIARLTQAEIEEQLKKVDQMKELSKAYTSHLALSTSPASSPSLSPSPHPHQHHDWTKHKRGKLRYCNWNIEWMDYLYESDTAFKKENIANGIDDVEALCKEIAAVIRELNADAIAIQEGPESLQKMELFVSTYLNNEYYCLGGFDGAQQRLYYIIKKNGAVKNPRIHKEGDDFLAAPWMFDVHGDFNLKEYKFTRRPLVVTGEITINAGDTRPIFFVALHTKSKFIAGGQKLWESKNALKKAEFIRKSVSNRRRIAGECTRTRKFLDDIIYQKVADPLIIVSGDMNDGPGMDFFEEYYLLFDSVSVLLGSPFQFKQMLKPLLIREKLVPLEDQWSIIFDDFVDHVKKRKMLLDHIFVSQALNRVVVQAAICHDLFAKHSKDTTGAVGKRGERVSDHRPVFADFF